MPSIIGETEDTETHVYDSNLDDRYINQTGDKLQGPLDMGFNRIINVPTPISPGDVANRDYVEITRRSTIASMNTLIAMQPKFYGFQLTKSVTATDTNTEILVTVPKGTDPLKVSLLATIPEENLIIKIHRSTPNNEEVLFNIHFARPVPPLVQNNLAIEGYVVIYPSPITIISSNKVQFALESGSLEIRTPEEMIPENMIPEENTL